MNNVEKRSIFTEKIFQIYVDNVINKKKLSYRKTDRALSSSI